MRVIGSRSDSVIVNSAAFTSLVVICSTNDDVFNVLEMHIEHAIVALDVMSVIAANIIINVGKRIHVRMNCIQAIWKGLTQIIVALVLILHWDAVRIHTVIVVPVVHTHLGDVLNALGSSLDLAIILSLNNVPRIATARGQSHVSTLHNEAHVSETHHVSTLIGYVVLPPLIVVGVDVTGVQDTHHVAWEHSDIAGDSSIHGPGCVVTSCISALVQECLFIEFSIFRILVILIILQFFAS